MRKSHGKYHVAHVVHSLNLGGAERLAADMALTFKDEFQTSILCLDEPGIWANGIRRQGIPVYCLYRHPGFDLRVVQFLSRYARRLKIDLFHAHQCTPWFYAGLSRFINPSTRLLLEEHGRHYPEVLNRKRNWVNRLVIQPLTSQITAVSGDVRERLSKYEGLSRRRIQVVYNGARRPEHLSKDERARVRQEFGFRKDDFIVGTIGRMDPIKNLPLFLKALAEVCKTAP